MPAYLVTLPAGGDFTLIDGKNAMVVVAHDATDAKAVAKSALGIDPDAPWAGATVTELAAAGDLEGYRLRVQLEDAGEVVVDITVEGQDTDGIDAIAADMVTALNATDLIANAAYNSTTNTLTIAGTDDALGDHRAVVDFLLPEAQAPGAVSIPGFVGTITDEGSSGAAVTVVLGADARVVPTILAKVKV